MLASSTLPAQWMFKNDASIPTHRYASAFKMLGGHESPAEKRGRFWCNDDPQGTQPHSSWVSFYAQKRKIFSPCIIKVLQQSLPKPMSASVNSELLTKSQFSAPTCAMRLAFIIANVSYLWGSCPWKSWPCWCLVGIPWWTSLQNSPCSLPVLVRDVGRGSNSIVYSVFQIKYTELKFFWCP